ncbi:EAL domain-containing protein [Thauera sp. SDU_THAU2]|uniref:EAL domain-containing protein n=1 Tax=Thauera sp. SDU_THAU2 TaxID=3136633 RepID=UPI00311EE058
MNFPDDSFGDMLEKEFRLLPAGTLTAGAIAHVDLLECAPGLSLCEAARLMSERRVSSILVVEEGQVLGIWTERDGLAIDFTDPAIFFRPISEVMSTPVRAVAAAMSLHELTQRFREEQMRHYLVVDEESGRRCGIVSLSDIVLNQGVEHYLKLRKVDSLIKGGLRVLPADTPMAEATRLMREAALDAVVVDFGADLAAKAQGRYGIMTERDVMRLVARKQVGLAIGELASRPLVTVDEHYSLYRARAMMTERRIRHIGVLHGDGSLADVISFRDILGSMELAYVDELQQALHESDRALSHSRRNLYLAEQVIESSLEGIMVTDTQGLIISVNPAFSRLTGYKAEEVVGRNPSLLSSGRQSPAFYARMWASLQTEGKWQGEIWNRRKSGEIYPELLHITAIRDEQGHVSHYAAVFTDITLLKETEARIRDLAYYDPLTGLPNRRLLEDRLQVELSHAARMCSRLAVMFVDLDRFKRINDSLGHEIGDRVLVEVASRIRLCLRDDDTVARMGGDEFIVLLGNLAQPDAAAATARRIVAALRRPVAIDGRELVVTTSIGISIYPDDSADSATLIKNADIAMYRAKEEGRNSFQLYQPAMNARSLEHLALETALHGALQRDQLLLHFQPLVRADTGEPVAVEALLRWQHPELGLVSPADFISLAEETGLIVPIGEWVLRHACLCHRRWREDERAPLRMMVNISARQFRQEGFVDMVRRVLHETAMEPSLLTLELTESMLMDDTEASVLRMQKLRELGVSLALDDFGTGYSSLAYLKDFPIDELKIDRLFVRGIDRNVRDAALASAIISLGHSLGLRVVAEGVETRAHLDVLQRHGCDLAQGFHFSKPLPWQSFVAAYG